jgi:hypothetical protein
MLCGGYAARSMYIQRMHYGFKPMTQKQHMPVTCHEAWDDGVPGRLQPLPYKGFVVLCKALYGPGCC